MNIIRAWKDKEYCMNLSDEERSLLPDNPAGPMELSDTELDSIIGGGGSKDNDSALLACIDSVACENSRGCHDTGVGICISHK